MHLYRNPLLWEGYWLCLMVENSGFKINVSSLTFQVNQIIGQLICVPLAAQLFNKNESSPISFLYISTSLEV